MFEKDAELAEKEYENCKFEEIEHYCDKAIYVTGFLAGLKAGRPQWHDLKKNPDDLPIEPDILKNEPDNHRFEWFIVAYVGKSTRALYSFAKKKWFDDYEEMMIGNSNFEPKAWCEIPTFDKEYQNE